MHNDLRLLEDFYSVKFVGDKASSERRRKGHIALNLVCVACEVTSER